MNLNIKQRIVAASIYFGMLLLLGYVFNSGFQYIWDKSNNWNMLLVVVALAIIMGNYITEPFFTKPLQVFTKWLSVFLFMVGLKHPEKLWYHTQLVWGSGILFLLSLILVILSSIRKLERFQKSGIKLLCEVSRPSIVFGLIYFLIVYSFFPMKDIALPWVVAFGTILIINKPINYIVLKIWRIAKFFREVKNSTPIIGKVIGFQSADSFTIESDIDLSEDLSPIGNSVGIIEGSKTYIGIIVHARNLLNKRWLTVKALKDSNNYYFAFDNSTWLESPASSISLTESNDVVMLNTFGMTKRFKEKISSHQIVQNIGAAIGIVWRGSAINKINIYRTRSSEFLARKNITEGSIVQTHISGDDVLYQIIDARTESESLESHDAHGYLTITAQKLGNYDTVKNELNVVKWVPEIFDPVFTFASTPTSYDANKFIGCLPGTTYGIPIRNFHELVTHNTAILGILGIGKSCLTFELLQKLLRQTEVKIICIDITNQYARALPNYFSSELIQDELPQDFKDVLRNNNPDGRSDDPSSWGNEYLYRTKIEAELQSFKQGDKRILILNPDWHPVSKAGTQYKIQSKVDLTVSEKTRIITERLFMIAKNTGETMDARFLIVFEEAHSLVPEWNSIANEGDKSATNGIAKVILQGRKYGLGSLVITQRTANISKSILNQCNTIFALRVFDDTGKQFLENYIGSDYSNLLPTLEERHAVAIGKALKLKQPVIIKLNDKDTLLLHEDERNEIVEEEQVSDLNNNCLINEYDTPPDNGGFH